MDADVTPYEPRPRWGHVSVTLGDKVYMWGGRTEDFTETQKKKVRKYNMLWALTLYSWDIL